MRPTAAVIEAPVPPSVDAPGVAPVATPVAAQRAAPIETPNAAPNPARCAPVEAARAVAEAPVVRNTPPPPPPEFKPFVLPAESGLVMVETSAAKTQSDGNAVQEDSTPPPAPRRSRPPRPVIPDEPLVMVETTHKD